MLKRVDWTLIAAFFGLIAIGSCVLYSATHGMRFSDETRNYFNKQMVWICIGLLFMIVIGCLNYRSVGNTTFLIYAVNLVLLIYVLIAGAQISGARRWITFGPFSIQPSEFMKLTLILTLASFLSMMRGREGRAGTFFAAFAFTVIPLLASTLKEPDLGTSVVLLPVMLVMLFVYGIKKRFVITFIVLGLLASPFAWLVLKPYQKSRILVFLNPENFKFGSGWTVIQSKIAIGSGQIFGKGWLSGTQSQLNFLPERHTDFIFAVLGEEAGFVGGIILLVLYCILLLRGIEIAQMARDDFGRYVACGIVTMIAFHVGINVAMTLGIVPVTGLPLPFISYGGSFLLTMMVSVGILLNIYAHNVKYR